MIEAILIDFLEERLGVPVYVMLPDELPDGGFIVLDRTGTEITNHIISYDIAIQSYGSTALGAASLNDAVIYAMEILLTDNRFSAVNLNNSYMFTDITRKRPRYQATYTITML